MENRAATWTDRRAQIGLCIIVGIWLLIHLGLRLLFTDVVALDPDKELLLAQSLRWTYDPFYPPLYTWLLWLLVQFTGYSVVPTLILKAALLTATALIAYRIARRLDLRPSQAVLATCSLAMMFQIGFNLIEGFSHTLTLIPAGLATLLAFLVMLQREDCGDAAHIRVHCILFLCVVLGGVSKDSFWPGFGCLLVAMLMQPTGRRALKRRGAWIGITLATILTLSFRATTLLGEPELSGQLQAIGGDPAAHRLTALVTVFLSTIGYLSPLVPLLLIVGAPKSAFRKELWTSRFNGNQAPPPFRLLRDATVAGLVLTAIMVLIAGAGSVPERWLHPLFLFTPLWLIAGVAKLERGGWAVRMTIMGALLATVVTVFRIGGYIDPHDRWCGRCRLATPYDGLAAELVANGLAPATLITAAGADGGNLLPFFHDHRITTPQLAQAVPGPPQDTPCTLVWRDGEQRPTAHFAGPWPDEAGATPIEIPVPTGINGNGFIRWYAQSVDPDACALAE